MNFSFVIGGLVLKNKKQQNYVILQHNCRRNLIDMTI